MSRQNQTTTAGEGFPVGFEIFNKPGNKLIHPAEGTYYVLNADNKVIVFGPQLAPLWNYASKKVPVQPITATEFAAVSPTAVLTPALAKTTVWPVIKKKTVPVVLKATPKKVAEKKAYPIAAKKPKKRLVNVIQMFNTDILSNIDQFVRKLGAQEPFEKRKEGPMLRVAYLDQQYQYDQAHPSGIATKYSSRR